MSRKQLLTEDEKRTRKAQHKSPCSDCPFARTALKGWLGSLSAGEWVAAAHGEAKTSCHTLELPSGQELQCAGLAIYRANVCKSPRDPSILELPQNREKVFAFPAEFLNHHLP